MDDFDPFKANDDEAGSDGDEDDGGNEDGSEGSGSENKNFVQLRKDRNRLERIAKSQAKELEELRTFKTDTVGATRKAEVKTIFDGFQVKANPELFLALNPEGDITAERVAGFLKENGLISADVEVPVTEVEVPTPTGFNPVVVNEGPTPEVISGEEARKIARSDPARYAQLRAQGKIKPEKLEDYFGASEGS